jgi:hypothetical protein
MSYEQCIYYTVLLAVVALDRPTLKAKVIDSPEVLAVIDVLPHARPFLSCLHNCQYAEFFEVRWHCLLVCYTACAAVPRFMSPPVGCVHAGANNQACLRVLRGVLNCLAASV